jgi:hypothetical protein
VKELHSKWLLPDGAQASSSGFDKSNSNTKQIKDTQEVILGSYRQEMLNFLDRRAGAGIVQDLSRTESDIARFTLLAQSFKYPNINETQIT